MLPLMARMMAVGIITSPMPKIGRKASTAMMQPQRIGELSPMIE